mgnify:CR=1 FL=1
MARNNIAWFARYYLNDHIKSELGALHKEWCNLMVNENKLAIAAPRGHAKSTWFTLVYPLWCILLKKKNFIVIISDSIEQASPLLGMIIEQLETNERIIRDFGKIAGYIPPKAEEKKKWTTKEIVTTTNIKVMARSLKSRIRGSRFGHFRPDLIILDDVENDENVQNEDQRLKTRNTFGNSIMNLGDRSTQIIVIGTILHFDSLLMNLINDETGTWCKKLYRAIENNRPIWPEWWTMEMFEEKKRDPLIGPIRFEQEYMNNPLDPTTQIFNPQEFYDYPLDMAVVDCFAYIDLAISEKQTADYTAIVTVGRHRQTGKIYLLDAVRFRGDIDKQLDVVFGLQKRFNYKLFGVESVAYQKVFQQILMKEQPKRQIYIPSIEIEIDKDKIRRATRVQPYVLNGTVIFSRSFPEFLAELIQFPKAAHDDFVDAFTGAVELATTYLSGDGVRVGKPRAYPKNI